MASEICEDSNPFMISILKAQDDVKTVDESVPLISDTAICIANLKRQLQHKSTANEIGNNANLTSANNEELREHLVRSHSPRRVAPGSYSADDHALNYISSDVDLYNAPADENSVASFSVNSRTDGLPAGASLVYAPEMEGNTSHVPDIVTHVEVNFLNKDDPSKTQTKRNRNALTKDENMRQIAYSKKKGTVKGLHKDLSKMKEIIAQNGVLVVRNNERLVSLNEKLDSCVNAEERKSLNASKTECIQLIERANGILITAKDKFAAFRARLVRNSILLYSSNIVEEQEKDFNEKANNDEYLYPVDYFQKSAYIDALFDLNSLLKKKSELKEQLASLENNSTKVGNTSSPTGSSAVLKEKRRELHSLCIRIYELNKSLEEKESELKLTVSERAPKCDTSGPRPVRKVLNNDYITKINHRIKKKFNVNELTDIVNNLDWDLELEEMEIKKCYSELNKNLSEMM